MEYEDTPIWYRSAAEFSWDAYRGPDERGVRLGVVNGGCRRRRKSGEFTMPLVGITAFNGTELIWFTQGIRYLCGLANCGIGAENKSTCREVKGSSLRVRSVES